MTHHQHCINIAALTYQTCADFGEHLTLRTFVSITFMVSTASSPPGLFQVEPSISAAGVLHFWLARAQAGRATVVLSARDDGGSDFDGSDTSAQEVMTIQVLPVYALKRQNSIVPLHQNSTVPLQDLKGLKHSPSTTSMLHSPLK
jgi:hypothetical protein